MQTAVKTAVELLNRQQHGSRRRRDIGTVYSLGHVSMEMGEISRDVCELKRPLCSLTVDPVEVIGIATSSFYRHSLRKQRPISKRTNRFWKGDRQSSNSPSPGYVQVSGEAETTVLSAATPAWDPSVQAGARKFFLAVPHKDILKQGFRSFLKSLFPKQELLGFSIHSTTGRWSR